MRRVVSVWFPTLPTDRIRRDCRLEEERGSAPHPAKGRRPLEPRYGGWTGGGNTAGGNGTVAPPCPSALMGSKGLRPFAGPGRSPGLPLVTVTGRTLTAVDAPGLRPGMMLAQAQVLVPGLVVWAADPVGDAAELGRLAQWCLQYAPLV